jgi:hypothetical protein
MRVSQPNVKAKVSPNVDRWAQEINGIGIATLIGDTLSGRGATNASQLDSLAMTIDAYRALDIAGPARAHPS